MQSDMRYVSGIPRNPLARKRAGSQPYLSAAEAWQERVPGLDPARRHSGSVRLRLGGSGPPPD